MNLGDIWCPNCMRYHASVTCCPTYQASAPMPQNNPMTELKTLLAFDNGYAIVKCRRVEWGTVDSVLSKLIRSTLEAAADRFCKLCPGPGCPGECKVSDKSDCGYWQIIAQKGKI